MIYPLHLGDDVDSYVGSFANYTSITIPLFRISRGKYLIGTEIINPIMKGTVCVIRRAGGYDSI